MDDADDLLVRWELGQSTAEDEAALAGLLADPGRRRAFLRQARIAAALTGLRIRTPARAAQAARPWHRRASAWALAAGLVAVVGAAALLVLGRDHGRGTRLLIASPGTTVESMSGSSRPVTDGATLSAGETVVSGGAGTVVAMAGEAARLELGPGTRLRLPDQVAADAPLRLAMTTGEALVEVAPRRTGAPLSIAGPNAIAEVVGTRFRFTANANADRLVVASGAVRFGTAADGGLMIGAGQSALATDGIVTRSPSALERGGGPPQGSQVLWQADPASPDGWRGIIDEVSGIRTWRSAATDPGNRWAFAEVRSPVAGAGWTVDAGTWIAFDCWTSGFDARHLLAVHLKPADETNYEAVVPLGAGDGWHRVRLQISRDFRHLGRRHESPQSGERIHGVVWAGLRVDGASEGPARFWIANAVVFRSGGD